MRTTSWEESMLMSSTVRDKEQQSLQGRTAIPQTRQQLLWIVPSIALHTAHGIGTTLISWMALRVAFSKTQLSPQAFTHTLQYHWCPAQITGCQSIFSIKQVIFNYNYFPPLVLLALSPPNSNRAIIFLLISFSRIKKGSLILPSPKYLHLLQICELPQTHSQFRPQSLRTTRLLVL